jgi:excisionase family DNA binding protein
MSKSKYSYRAGEQRSPLPPQKRLISTKKAADRLDVSLGQVRKFIAGGRLIGYKVGRLLKVDVNQVDALVETIDNS